MISGQLIRHPQLGVGKILEVNGDILTVVFLFFWPGVTVRADQVSVFTPSDAFKTVVDALSEHEVDCRKGNGYGHP